MIETISITLWSLADEKIFLGDVIGRFKGRSATADRFGAPETFIAQYLAGLDLRIVNFNGTGKLEAFERAVIRDYAEELLCQPARAAV